MAIRPLVVVVVAGIVLRVMGIADTVFVISTGVCVRQDALMLGERVRPLVDATPAVSAGSHALVIREEDRVGGVLDQAQSATFVQTVGSAGVAGLVDGVPLRA